MFDETYYSILYNFSFLYQRQLLAERHIIDFKIIFYSNRRTKHLQRTKQQQQQHFAKY